MAWYDDESAAVPSDWFAQEEAMQQPVSSDWWAQEEAKAGPAASSDWFLQEEAKAGPEASLKDIKASYPEAFKDVPGKSSASLSGVAGALKQLGSGLLGKTQSPEGLLELLLLGNALAGYLNPKYGKEQPAGYQGKINMGLKATQPTLAQEKRAYGEGAKGQAYFGPTTYAAEGGIMELAKGGSPRYLDGPTDGMADKINTSIDDRQPAKLSHGEFVIPADVVSHLGNGNSSAGAKVLYAMMAKVRKARTGNKKQGKQINPAKFMPGGIAAYAGGGAVAFADGGATSTTSNLSSWIGPYVSDYLAKGKALADKPYEAYKGQLTAGTAPLQTQGFAALSATPGYQPTSFGNQFTAPTAYQTGQFDTGLGGVKSVGEYMSPYMQNVVGVQTEEARRQADIDRVANMQRMTRAGGYGGSRQAIMESEGQRNLQTQLGTIQATGLQSAYDKALAQRLAESEASMGAQKATEASRQFGAGQAMTGAQEAAKYGLEGQRAGEESKQFGAKYDVDTAKSLIDAGGIQRLIEQQALDARRAQFEAERADPYKKIQFQQSLIEGLPVSTTSSGTNTSGMQELAALIAAMGGVTK